MNAAFAVLTILLGAIGSVGLVGIPAALFFAPVVAGPIVKRLIDLVLGCRFCLVALTVLIAGVGGYWAGHWGEYSRGEADAIAGIAANDTVLVGRATQKRRIMHECKAQGGIWVQSKGTCR